MRPHKGLYEYHIAVAAARTSNQNYIFAVEVQKEGYYNNTSLCSSLKVGFSHW